MSWKVLQRWFNCPPQPNARFITDNRGEKYWIFWDVDESESLALLDVKYRGRWVGNISVIREEGRKLTLADIVIFERYYELRGHGIGYAMMNEFIQWAKEKEYKEIWGFITPHDGSTIEELRKWYKRQGFTVYEAKPEVFHILLKM